METPELVETLATIQAEAARAVDMLLVAHESGEHRISGITSLRKIETLARDRLAPAAGGGSPSPFIGSASGTG